MKSIVYILCTALYAVSLFCDIEPLALSEGSPMYTHLTYMFCHGSLLHYSANMLGIYLLFKSCRFVGIASACTKSVVCSFLASFVPVSGMVVGLSGAVYAMLGMLLVYIRTKDYAISLLFTALANAAIAILGGKVAWQIHLAGFVIGFLIELIWKQTKDLNFQRKTLNV